MTINKKLIPIKAHFFFLLGATGSVLPQVTVFGKELGISSVVMGTVNAILPIMFFLAKPLFGVIVDICRNYRKSIFLSLIVVMTVFFSSLYIIPPRPLVRLHFQNFNYSALETCNVTKENFQCGTGITPLICNSNCLNETFFATYTNISGVCASNDLIWENDTCELTCVEDLDINTLCLSKTFTFWGFIIFMTVGCVTCNVVNSISDAICFDVIGEGGDYGKQRVWGTVGYGVAALTAGSLSNLFSNGENINYAPFFIVMAVCCIFDIATCTQLQLPIIEAPKNIIKEFGNLLKSASVATFLTFATFVGILDSIIMFFLFWYLEDLAVTTNTQDVKLIEGFVVAGQTLGGEILFFSISGKIIEKFGHANTFTACFFFYALRLGSIALAPSPWWIAAAEFCFSGPTYALAYSVIVAYANELAPPGASATMQGIAAGMDDGFGFCIGSFIAGYLFKYIGAKNAFYIYSSFGIFCALAHFLLHKTLLAPAKSRFDIKHEAVNAATQSGAHACVTNNSRQFLN